MAVKKIRTQRTNAAVKAKPVAQNSDPSSDDTPTHAHQPGGKIKAKANPKMGAAALLKAKAKGGGSAKSKKKDDTPLVTLTDSPKQGEYRAHKLLELQQAKAEYKALEGKVQSLEGSLFDVIEAGRLDACHRKRTYVGSIKVTGKGLTPPALDAKGNSLTDEEGNVLSHDGQGGFMVQQEVNPGVASYYIQNKYKVFNTFAESKDDEIQEEYDDPTIQTEMVVAVQRILNTITDEDGDEVMLEEGDEGFITYGEAEVLVKSRLEVEVGASIDPAALALDDNDEPINPEVYELLQDERLLPFIQMTSKAKPTKAFHEQAQYDERESAIMAALNGIGLCQRYKAVLKPSGAPRQ